MADPFFSSIPYSAIVPSRLSAIQLTRGGGGGAFGGGAAADTIAMASASSDDLALVSAEALYGSREATELSATASPDVGTGFVSVSGLYERGDGLDPAQTTRHAGSATLSWLPKQGSTLTVALRYFGQPYENDLNIDSLPDALTADGFVQLGLGRGVALTGRVESIFHTLIYTWRLIRPTLS